MYCVYILSSLSSPDRKYVGHTKDIKHRLVEHNSGECVHTAKFIPWKISMVIYFDEKPKAIDFEKYLKSGSGRAFAKRHF